MRFCNNFSDSENTSELDDILAARSGDRSAFEKLIAEYSKKIKAISASYVSASLTADDWFQEGMIGFLKAVETYQPGKGEASFGAYCTVCVKNRLNSVYRSVNSKKNLPLNNYLLFDEGSELYVPSAEDEYIERERNLLIYEYLPEQLSKAEKDVFVCYMEGLSYKETASKLKLTEKAVDNALCRAKSKLKKAFST